MYIYILRLRHALGLIAHVRANPGMHTGPLGATHMPLLLVPGCLDPASFRAWFQPSTCNGRQKLRAACGSYAHQKTVGRSKAGG